MQATKSCPTCGKTKGLRYFCRPKLQIQKTCNDCWRKATAADPRRAQNALLNGTIPASILGRLTLAAEAKRKAKRAKTLKRLSKTASVRMKKYWKNPGARSTKARGLEKLEVVSEG
jgi:hypothetical protein